MFHFGLVAVAVVFGALLPYVVDPASQVLVIIAAIVICLVLWFAPTKLLRAAPRFATWLYQGGYVLVFIIIAASTAFASWLAFAVPGWLAAVPEAQQSHVSGVVVGALNALIGALWLDAAKDPESKLWPQGRHRAHLSAAFADVDKLKGDRDSNMELLYSAIYDDQMTERDITGWSFAARLARAGIIATYDR
ncbi:MAG: hypothetical protein GKR99_14515 [Rhodobacteraceae bacterium]|nr:hypothetical protein [Paracoccaceae bacterium]